MRTNLLMTLMVAAVMAALPAVGQAPVTVTVDDYSFDPAVLNIAVGTTVVWTNVGQIEHEVEAHLKTPAGEFVTMVNLADPLAPQDFEADLEPGDSFAYTFENAGVWLLNCNEGGQHATMKQLIIVS